VRRAGITGSQLLGAFSQTSARAAAIGQ